MKDSEKKKKGWFDISTRENCESAITIGWVIIVITSCITSFAIFNSIALIKRDPIFSISPIISYIGDYSHFVNILIYFVLAFFMLRNKDSTPLLFLLFILKHALLNLK